MTDQTIASPCIGVCSMDDLSGLCMGCFRTIEEIQDWWDLDDASKQAIIVEASVRESSVFDG
ncbi:MAG: DUF1289 domain-containing protein [Methylophilaceae bacterium 17-44-8]|jgi:hypothetical protein|nr:MAG: DUF1289 domain-containing protein [Methylophilales bacterium 28-44-11]OZA06835.1 MAG: DUF1289 domain-containing protein [Methylophilaceae bacterium 17-44-8]